MQEVQLLLRRHEEQAIRLRDAARDLRQELRPSDADGDRQPDLVPHAASKRARDLERRADAALHPAHVEEGLVDRQRLDDRRRVLENAEDGLRRLRVGLEARRHDDRLRAELSRAALAHRGAHAERLRLVARGEHDAHPDDHRLRLEARLVPLLDRGEERVQVGVQDRRHERMFA